MARVKFGAIVTDMRGKLGGHVFQKGNQSRVMKTGSKPSVTRTFSNVTTNSFVRAAQTAWNALSLDSKNQFEQAAKNFPQKSTFGDTINLNGYQFFLVLNTRNLRAGNSIITSTSGIEATVNTPAAGTFSMDIATSSFPTSLSGSFAGRRILKEVAWYKGYRSAPNEKDFHFLENSLSFTADGTANYTAFLTNFGQPSVTNTIFARYCLVNVWGIRSQWFTNRVEIT